MTALLIILLILAVAFGVGAVLEGLAWLFLITVGLIVVAAILGFTRMGRRAT